MNDKGNNGSELEKTKDVIYNQLEFPIKRDKNCRTFKAILYQKLLKKNIWESFQMVKQNILGQGQSKQSCMAKYRQLLYQQ